MTKPKPAKPAPPETPPPASPDQASEPRPQGGEAEATSNPANEIGTDGSSQAPPPEPMETEKAESVPSAA